MFEACVLVHCPHIPLDTQVKQEGDKVQSCDSYNPGLVLRITAKVRLVDTVPRHE
jgi:hypothetical protein